MQNQPRSKQNHFVPQNHLRRFATTSDQIQVFDKTTGKQFPSSVKNVGGETDFSGTQEAEKALSQADAKFKTIVDGILLNLENGKFTPDNKKLLAPYIALQMMRTRGMRDTITEVYLTIVSEIARRKDCQIDLSKFKVTMNPNYAKYIHLVALFDQNRLHDLAQYLYEDYIWFAGVNETAQPFWTSDTPVVIQSHSEKGETWREQSMLNAAERQFALNPKCLLILLKRRFAKHLEDKEGSIICLTEQQVVKHNILQISQCTRQVYSPSPDFTIAKKIAEYLAECNTNPKRDGTGLYL